MQQIKIFTLIISSLFLTGIFSQQVNWSSDVASVIYTKCTSCHRTGGIAPFTLENYQECVDRSNSIKNAVESDNMPPWPPDPSYSRFAHERSLNADQKNKILNWIANNTPRGDISKEPKLPIFPNSGDLTGVPDAVHNAPLFNIKASSDIYQCFVISNTESIDRYISAMEVIPGNRSAVHHVLVYYDKTGEAKRLDDATTEPGYLSFGGVGVNSVDLIGAWVPGSTPQVYPKGMGVKLPAKGHIIMQIHYPRSSDGQMDQTQLKLFYSKESNVRQVLISPILDHLGSLTNGPLIIPANTIKTFNAQYSVNSLKATILSVAPHMHLIGKSIEVYSLDPNNVKTNFIKINDWDFHWQGYYSFPKPIILNPGSKLISSATYDNTSNNPNNPNSPPKLVTLGEKTTDEMMLVYFSYLLYRPGDENIVIDSSFFSSIKETSDSDITSWNIYLNEKSNAIIHLSPDLKGSYVQIYNIQGQLIQNQKLSNEINSLYIPATTSGIVYVQLQNGGKSLIKKLYLE